jgi:hypothetical protein
MFSFNKEDLEAALSQSFKNYEESGPRSTEKLKPLHQYFAGALKNIWGEEYGIHYLGDRTKEFTVSGKYYEKVIDITVTDKNKPIFCLGLKFVTSNYKQNANNYFEGMMGETANVQALRCLPYAQMIILRYETPYYKKSKDYYSIREKTKDEIINTKDLQKYLNLTFDIAQAHRPHILGIVLIIINETTKKVVCLSPGDYFEKKFADLLESSLSAKHFFDEIIKFKKYYSLNKNGNII